MRFEWWFQSAVQIVRPCRVEMFGRAGRCSDDIPDIEVSEIGLGRATILPSTGKICPTPENLPDFWPFCCHEPTDPETRSPASL